MKKYLYFLTFIGLLLAGCKESKDHQASPKKPVEKALERPKASIKDKTSKPESYSQPEKPEKKDSLAQPQVQIEVTQPQFQDEEDGLFKAPGIDSSPQFSTPSALEPPPTHSLSVKINPQTYRPHEALFEDFKNSQRVSSYMYRELFSFYEQGFKESYILIDCTASIAFAIEELYQSISYLMRSLHPDQKLGLALIHWSEDELKTVVVSSSTDQEKQMLLAFQKFNFNGVDLKPSSFGELFQAINNKWGNQRPLFLITDKSVAASELEQVQAQLSLLSVLKAD